MIIKCEVVQLYSMRLVCIAGYCLKLSFNVKVNVNVYFEFDVEVDVPID